MPKIQVKSGLRPVRSFGNSAAPGITAKYGGGEDIRRRECEPFDGGNRVRGGWFEKLPNGSAPLPVKEVGGGAAHCR
jgi:hypothetical protein